MSFSEKIIFIHIPKASGSSARKFFEDAFGKENVAWLGSQFVKDDLNVPNNPAFDKYKVIGGHFSFSLAQNIAGSKVYISVYRDTLSRAISLYRFIQRNPKHHLHKESLDYSMTEMIAKCPSFKAQVSNLQAKFLSDLEVATQPFVKVEDVLNTIHTERFYICNIRNVADMFHEFAKDYAIARPVGYGRENASKTATLRDELWDRPDVIQKLKSINSVDIELCSYLDERLSDAKFIKPDLITQKCQRIKARRSYADVDGPAHVFLHVPKTGGTSLHNILVANYQGSEVCPERFNNLKQIDINQIRGYKYYSGHYDWSSLSYIEREKKLVTLLRNPKKRIISLYHFWRSHTLSHIEKHSLNGPRLAKSHGFSEFLDLLGSGVASNIDNVLARNFVGRNFVGKYREFLYPEDEIFDRAYENISCLDAVGFMEFMKPSVDRVVSALGFVPPQTIPRERDSRLFSENPAMELIPPPVITDEVDEKLEKLTRHDSRIYEKLLDEFFEPMKKGGHLSEESLGVCFTDEWERDERGTFYTENNEARINLRVDTSDDGLIVVIECLVVGGGGSKISVNNIDVKSGIDSSVEIKQGAISKLYIPTSIMKFDEFNVSFLNLAMESLDGIGTKQGRRLFVKSISVQ
jgi:hypothetical protein